MSYTWRYWITADFQYRRNIYGILWISLYGHVWIIYRIPYFHIWFWRAIQIRRNVCWALLRECLQDIYTLGILPLSSQFEYDMSGTWKENKRSTLSLNFDDTSKFWGEKCIGSSRFNVYRFFFASHLQMTQELSLKVYKVKACLLRLKCSVNSKYKTQVLFSLDCISFQFLYVIGRHISLIR